jgi:5-histidylcysteine sulfoxide synthase/putative 4-mercaptohistidine N1-methyltranferase
MQVDKKFLPSINLKNITKNEIKQYFLTSYNVYESLFDILKDKSFIYERPNPLRHPLVFYYGHTATFFINKMKLAGLVGKSLNAKFENIFSIGVDEMGWDNINKASYKWPSFDELKNYRDEVKQIVLKVIDESELILPINWDSPFWCILMGIEHEKIHIETSSVLIREMDFSFVLPHKDFMPFKSNQTSFLKNEMINIKGGEINIGKNHNDNEYYGWDNEYGTHKANISNFQVSKYLVSNGEFMEFVKDDGYKQDKFFSKEGALWKNKTKAKMPFFWSKKENEYFLRDICDINKLPLSRPVEVNFYEAEAFINYINDKQNTSYRLPSEDEYYKMLDFANIENKNANINCKYNSSTPVDLHNFNGIYDVIGNVWQWSISTMYPFDGFKTHKLYDDFTMPTFDGKHALIKGGSFISNGNGALKESRYAFRKHFLQHSGFRYVNSKEEIKIMSNIYESDELISQYCEFHYGDSYFNVGNFCKKTVESLKEFIKNKDKFKALDLGCSVGRASFELAKIYDEVTGIDFSANFIKVAQSLQNDNEIKYSVKEEGEINNLKTISLKSLGFENIKDKINFHQGDACNLNQIHNNYDLILCNNLIDRLYNPSIFLKDIQTRINKGGILAISSPYTWLEEYTKKDKWLGGYKKDDKDILTLESLKSHLSGFKLKKTIDVEFVIRETKRKYQHSVSQMSIWEKV